MSLGYYLGDPSVDAVDSSDPQSVLDFLYHGGYSCVLEYSGKRAYITDEDGDDGRRMVPVAVVRSLIAAQAIAIWRGFGEYNHRYNTYRPTAWVQAWNAEQAAKRQAAEVAG